MLCKLFKKSISSTLVLLSLLIYQSIYASPDIEKFALDAWQNNYEAVEKEINRGINVDQLNKEGATALDYAAAGGNCAIVELLINNKANVNGRDKDGDTPLTWAASYNKPEAMELLIKHGAKVEPKDQNIRNLVMKTAKKGWLDVVRSLKNAGADVSLVDNRWFKVRRINLNAIYSGMKDLQAYSWPDAGEPQLLSAALNNDIEIMEILIKRGIGVKADTFCLSEVLTEATQNDWVDVIKLLKQAGADLTITNANGFTLYTEAAANNSVKVIKLLIDEKMDINQKDRNGKTPLMAAEENKKTEAMDLLVKNGAQKTEATEPKITEAEPKPVKSEI